MTSRRTDLAHAMPPADLDSEAAVIAACLIDNDKIPDAAAVLPDESAFFRDVHARLWRVVLDLWSAGGPVDAVTVAAEGERRGLVEFEEGFGLSTGLFQMMSTRSLSWHAVAYARSVRRAADLRAVIETAEAMLQDAYRARDEPEAVVARSVERLTTMQARTFAGSTETLADLMPAVVGKLASRAGGVPTGLLTPWAELNFMTDGIQPTDFVVVAARPSMGKTSFALNLADFAAVDYSVPTLFVSLEMGNLSLAERLLVARARVDGHHARTGRLTPGDWRDIDAARAAAEAAPVRFVRRPGRSLSEIVGEVRRAHARQPLGLVVVDYIQLIRGDNPRENEVQALTRISGDLKGLTVQLGVPVVALSQLNRQLETRDDKRPKMADIRGSGSIEQDADLILLLHRPDYFDPSDRPGVAECIVGKNRNNPVGEFRLTFVKSQMRFEDFDADAGFVPPPLADPDF